MKKNFLVLALFVLLPAASVFALPVIDFGTGLAGIGGTITITGDNAVGTDIHIGVLTANETGNDGIYVVNGTGWGALSFDTAAGTIQIVGGIPDLDIPEGTVLLSGTITSYTLTSGAFGSINARGIDTKAPELLEALGVPLDTPFAFFGFSIGTVSGGLDPGVYQVVSSDIVNQAVPEPTSMLLLGSGLLALAGISRLRRK